MNPIRMVADCATPPRRIEELLAILAKQHDRLRAGTVSMIQKGAWTMRDDRGWINHSSIPDPESGNVAITITDGRDLIVLEASDVSLRKGTIDFRDDPANGAPFPAREREQARDAMLRGLTMFETLILERASARRIRTNTAKGMALLTDMETRLKAIGIMLSGENDREWPVIALQARCPWRNLEAVGTIGGKERRMLDSDRADNLWKGLPTIASITVSPPGRPDPGRVTKTRSWRVDVHPITIEWTDDVDSVVERMRLLASLPIEQRTA